MYASVSTPKARRSAITRAFPTMDRAFTFDAESWQRDDSGNVFQQGQVLALDASNRPVTFATHDGKTADSTGAFLVGELERLDPKLHMPLTSVSWQRDIDLREDVTIADEFSSFTLTTFGSQGGLGAGNGIRNGKAWIGKATDQISGVGVDTGKTPQPLTPWGLEVKYTILELASAAKMGRPVDDQKIEAVRLKNQMDTDEQVYVGDANIGAYGLFNHPAVTNVSNVPNGASASPLWASKTPAELLADVNALIVSVWTASGFARMPNKILLPPVSFGYISSAVVSTAGSVSILQYLLQNNILKSSGMGQLVIAPCKWLVGAGVAGTIGVANGNDRMIAYSQDKDLVRFPMTTLQRTPIQYDSIYHKFTYYCRLGVVELVYPETVGFRDGL